MMFVLMFSFTNVRIHEKMAESNTALLSMLFQYKHPLFSFPVGLKQVSKAITGKQVVEKKISKKHKKQRNRRYFRNVKC